MSVRVERVYEAPDGGVRVLVDRLWPRGLKKEDAQLDRWAKEIAPSTELRQWFHGPQSEYGEFARRYRTELDAPQVQQELAELRELAQNDDLVLLTAVKEPSHSHVNVLLERLEQAD